jgi:SHS2 domain-containing protein
MSNPFRELPHTADVAIEVWGRELPELFAHAAQGLFSLAVDVQPNAPISAYRQVDLSAADWETLLVDWLNEILLLYEEHGEAYVTFEISLPRPGALSARAGATRAFTPVKVIKAATFHELAITRDARGYHTVVVFDV